MHNRRPHLVVCLLLEFISYTLGMGIDLDQIDPDQIDPDVESAITPTGQRASAAPKTANQQIIANPGRAARVSKKEH